MLYEMLAGSRPFDNDSKVALLGMHVTARVPPFAERAPAALVPTEVEAIVMRLLRKEMSDRYTDAKELIEALVGVMALLIERGRIEPRGVVGAILSGPSTSSPNLKPLLTAAQMGGRMGSQVTISSPVAARAPLASIDARVGSESGGIRLPAPPPRGNRFAGFAATVLAILSLIAISMIVNQRPKKGLTAAPDGAAIGSSAGGAQNDTPSPDEERIRGALASIDKGDYGTGIATLTTLEAGDMDRADVHRALMKAYLATGATADGMREAGLLVKADPSAGNDPKLLEDVRNAALGGGQAGDQAFALLETSLGSAGPDILYDLVYTTVANQYPTAAKRATRALASTEVRSRFNPGLQVAMDLRGAAGSCEKVKAILPRAQDMAGIRALAVLKGFLPTRGCGFLATRDCWPCLHKDGSLAKTIAAIEERTAATAPRK
jgi:serine/threonine-protein kinase